LGEPDQNTEPSAGCQAFFWPFATEGTSGWAERRLRFSAAPTAPGVTPPAEKDSTLASTPCQALSPTFCSSSGDSEASPRCRGPSAGRTPVMGPGLFVSEPRCEHVGPARQIGRSPHLPRGRHPRPRGRRRLDARRVGGAA